MYSIIAISITLILFWWEHVISKYKTYLIGQSSKVQKYPNPGQIAKEFILAGMSLYICVL